MNSGKKISGVGVGLRPSHYGQIFDLPEETVPWFEILADNFIVGDGMPVQQLRRLSEKHPVTFHSVGMSLGSPDPIDLSYLQAIKDLGQRIGAAWYSDHLCFTGLGGTSLGDLLPLPYTDECVRQTAKRIKQTQDFLESRILIENVSQYLQYKSSQLSEWEFVNAVAEEADCYILLDINNIYVNAFNQQMNPHTYIQNISKDRVKQFHLAGHTKVNQHLIDTHGAHVVEPVWELYSEALERFGSIPTLIEWDNNLPPFKTLLQEKAR